MSLLQRLLTWLDAHPALARVFWTLYRLLFPPPTRFDVHFRVLGFLVRVHPAFWLAHVAPAAFVATAEFLRGNPWWPLVFVLCFACTAGAILAHELGHVLAGRRFGGCSEIVLTFFGGFARMTYVSYALGWDSGPSRRQRVLVTLAGPAVNLVIAAVALVAWVLIWPSAEEIYRAIANNSDGIPPPGSLELLVLALGCTNLMMGLSNLVPIPPLDGGWIALEAIGWVRTRSRLSRDGDASERWNRG